MDGCLKQLRTLSAHQSAKLSGHGAARGILAKNEAGDSNDNEQHWPNRCDGIERDSSAPCQCLVFQKAIDAILYQSPDVADQAYLQP